METTEKPKREINQNPELLQYIRKCPVFNNNKTVRYEKKWECLIPTGGRKKTSNWNCFQAFPDVGLGRERPQNNL